MKLKIIENEYTATIDTKKRLTIRGAKHHHYAFQIYKDGKIVLSPSILVDPNLIPKSTLKIIDNSVSNKKKNISYRSSELLNALNQEEKQFFTLQETMKILVLSEPDAVRKLLADMAKRGLIFRIKDGLYNVILYERNSEEYFPNWHLAAEAIVQPEEFYISF